MRSRLFRTLFVTSALAGGLLVGCDGGDDDVVDDDDMVELPDVGGDCSAASSWEIWVPRQGANDLRIVDQSLSITDMLDFSGTGLISPHNVTLGPNQAYAFFAMLGSPDNDFAEGGVNIVDTNTRDVVASVVTGAKTHQVGVTPDGNTAWAVNVNNDTISIIDLSGGVANATITEVVTVGGTGGALVAKFSSDGSKAYITNKGVVGDNSSVSVFDTGTLMKDGADYVTGQVTTEEALTSDGNTLYVTNGGDNNVEKIDLTAADRSTAVEVFASDIGGSHAIQLAEKHVIVTARGDGQVVFFDGDGNLVNEVDITATMGNAQPDIIALSPDCKTVYAAEKTGGSLVELDVATQMITNTLDFGGGTPHGVAVRSL